MWLHQLDFISFSFFFFDFTIFHLVFPLIFIFSDGFCMLLVPREELLDVFGFGDVKARMALTGGLNEHISLDIIGRI